MKQKIVIFIIYWLIFFLIWVGSSYIFLSKNIFNNDNSFKNTSSEEKNLNINNDKNNQSINKTNVTKSNTWITLKEALSKPWHFSKNINFIKDDFNSVELLISEFKKINDKNDLKDFENKFWSQNWMMVFLKIKDKDLFLKYMDLSIDLDKELKDNALAVLTKIIDWYIANWYYDDLWYKDEDGTYDYFRLSLMSLGLEEKLNICKDSFKKQEDYNSCSKYVIYMSSTTKNKYCDKLSDYEKRICDDTLKLIK